MILLKNQQNLDEWKIRTNVPLQICLYFNFYLIVFWIAVQVWQWPMSNDNLINGHLVKVNQRQVFTFLWTASFTLLCLVELGRLYAGYVGNQLEKPQHLLAFVFLTACLQFPNHIFRLTVLQQWNWWHSITPIISTLIIIQLLLLETIFASLHLRAIFHRIYLSVVDHQSHTGNE